jgi:hypothetical protein
MSINRTRDRAIRALQAERGVKYGVATRMWEQENPEHAARYREARARLTDQTDRQPPQVNVDKFLDDLEGRLLHELDLTPPPGVPDAVVTGAYALADDVTVEHAKSSSRGFVDWRLSIDVELTTAGVWAGSLVDAKQMPHVAALDATTGVATLKPGRARITYAIRTQGNPPKLKEARATLSWASAASKARGRDAR